MMPSKEPAGLDQALDAEMQDVEREPLEKGDEHMEEVEEEPLEKGEEEWRPGMRLSASHPSWMWKQNRKDLASRDGRNKAGKKIGKGTTSLNRAAEQPRKNKGYWGSLAQQDSNPWQRDEGWWSNPWQRDRWEHSWERDDGWWEHFLEWEQSEREHSDPCEREERARSSGLTNKEEKEEEQAQPHQEPKPLFRPKVWRVCSQPQVCCLCRLRQKQQHPWKREKTGVAKEGAGQASLAPGKGEDRVGWYPWRGWSTLLQNAGGNEEEGGRKRRSPSSTLGKGNRSCCQHITLGKGNRNCCQHCITLFTCRHQDRTLGKGNRSCCQHITLGKGNTCRHQDRTLGREQKLLPAHQLWKREHLSSVHLHPWKRVKWWWIFTMAALQPFSCFKKLGGSLSSAASVAGTGQRRSKKPLTCTKPWAHWKSFSQMTGMAWGPRVHCVSNMAAKPCSMTVWTFCKVPLRDWDLPNQSTIPTALVVGKAERNCLWELEAGSGSLSGKTRYLGGNLEEIG